MVGPDSIFYLLALLNHSSALSRLKLIPPRTWWVYFVPAARDSPKLGEERHVAAN